MTAEEFEKYKTSQINTYSEKPINQEDTADFYWTEITSRRYMFEKNDTMVDLLKNLRKEDVVDYFKVNV